MLIDELSTKTLVLLLYIKGDYNNYPGIFTLNLRILSHEPFLCSDVEALAFEQLLSLPEMARGLCHCWGLKATRAFAAVAKSSGNSGEP